MGVGLFEGGEFGAGGEGAEEITGEDADEEDGEVDKWFHGGLDPEKRKGRWPMAASLSLQDSILVAS